MNASRGIAISGLEFGQNIPGSLNTDYFSSANTTFNYFGGKGFNTVRLPFMWERLQPVLNGALDPTYKGYIDDQITKAGAAGLKVILDCHNFGRRQVYTNGGITEAFTEANPSLQYPYADYTQAGYIVLRDFGESYFGTPNNPVNPATSYKVTFNMKFNSKDTSFGAEGLYIKLMKSTTSANSYYEFAADEADGTWALNKWIGGVKTILASGTKAWGLSSTYAVVIDIGQATSGKVNVSVDGTPLFTTNSVATDGALTNGYVTFLAQGVHVKIDTLILNVAGDTSSGGNNTYTVGGGTVTTAHLADLWSRLATAYEGNTTVYAYDIMNEPHDMAVPTTSSNYNSTATVTLMMQAAINAIRLIDTIHFIIAELDSYAGGQSFVSQYGSNPTPWLTDATGLLVYSFHYYFDNDHSGTYAVGFTATNNNNIATDVTPIMQWAQNHNVLLHCGEFGVPNTSDWQVCLTTFLTLCDTYLVWANHWAAGDPYTSITTLQPTGTPPSFTDRLQMAVLLQHLGTLYTASPATPTPTTPFSNDVPFLGPTTRLDIDLSNTLGGTTYSLGSTIDETVGGKLTFIPQVDPQKSIDFKIVTKGTGDWTVTIHDGQNKVIATQTILNANLPSSGYVEFIFLSVWRNIINKPYHAHLTSSDGTGTVEASTLNNFSTTTYHTYYQFLVTDTQFHPVIQFQYQPLGGTLTGAMIIGNERYLAVYDGLNYIPNFIAFPPAWKVRCFGFWREYLAIGMWRGGNIYDFDAGRIYFWSGNEPAFDFFIDVPEGQINALFGVDSDLYIFAGWRGYLLDYKGGYFYNTGNSESNKLKFIPKRSENDYFEIYPQALTMWRGILHFGLTANSNSTTVERGIYSFGTYNQWYPETLSYDYPISTGNTNNSVNIGLAYPIGKQLIIGWQDGISYGADVIDFANPPSAIGTIETLILDDNVVWKDKTNYAARADFLSLRNGEGVAIDASINRSTYSSSTPQTIVGSQFAKLPIGNGRSREIQLKVTLTAGATSPTFLGMALKKDDLPEEDQF